MSIAQRSRRISPLVVLQWRFPGSRLRVIFGQDVPMMVARLIRGIGTVFIPVIGTVNDAGKWVLLSVVLIS